MQNLDYMRDMEVERGVLGAKETIRMLNETRTNEWWMDMTDVYFTHD